MNKRLKLKMFFFFEYLQSNHGAANNVKMLVILKEAEFLKHKIRKC